MLSKSPAIDETTPAAELDIDVVLHRFDELTGTLYEIVTDRAPRALARRQLTIRNFEARLRWTHGDAFDALDLLQLCCEEVAQALFTNVDNAPDSRGRAKNELLYRLLTRACLTTSEPPRRSTRNSAPDTRSEREHAGERFTRYMWFCSCNR